MRRVLILVLLLATAAEAQMVFRPTSPDAIGYLGDVLARTECREVAEVQMAGTLRHLTVTLRCELEGDAAVTLRSVMHDLVGANVFELVPP